jgi:3-oxoacyl-[acyl-carrier protein] reductase
VNAAVEKFGGLDIVVNNAGTTHRNRPMTEVDEATFDRVFAVNVKSLFWMAKAAIPVLRRQGRGGSIINIGSTAGIRPRPGLVWYNGTKGAVNIMTQCMAIELARDNIRVNSVCPVAGATALLEQFMGRPDTPEARAPFLATIPLGRLSTPADIANACLWLSEDSSSFITGVLLPVDGGRTA